VGASQRTARASGVRRVYLTIVNHLLRVAEKERRDVCTSDEQRKVSMDKVGTSMAIW